MSRLVDDLERERLVERVPDPADGRATLAVLTAEGRRAFRRAAPVYLRGIEAHFTSHLSEKEHDVIARGLQRVIAHHDANEHHEGPRRSSRTTDQPRTGA